MKHVTKIIIALFVLAFQIQSLQADACHAGSWLALSENATVVEASAEGISEFTGASSAVFSYQGKRHRIGTKGTQLQGDVRESVVATPFGNADLLQATYARSDMPFQYTLKVKRLKDINAFTVQAVLHNRSDEDIRLHEFDLFDMRKGQGGALNVADPSAWLVTPLMEDTDAVTYDLAEKRLNEAALFKNAQGAGFLVGPVGPADAYTNVQFSNQEFRATVAMDNVLVPAGETRRSEEMIFCFEPTTTATNIWTRWVAATHGASFAPWPCLRLVQLVRHDHQDHCRARA